MALPHAHDLYLNAMSFKMMQEQKHWNLNLPMIREGKRRVAGRKGKIGC